MPGGLPGAGQANWLAGGIHRQQAGALAGYGQRLDRRATWRQLLQSLTQGGLQSRAPERRVARVAAVALDYGYRRLAASSQSSIRRQEQAFEG